MKRTICKTCGGAVHENRDYAAGWAHTSSQNLHGADPVEVDQFTDTDGEVLTVVQTGTIEFADEELRCFTVISTGISFEHCSHFGSVHEVIEGGFVPYLPDGESGNLHLTLAGAVFELSQAVKVGR